MKIIAAIDADLETTPLGTRSRLAELLAGRSVLSRTIDRVLRAGEVASVHVVCPEQQLNRCRELSGTRPVKFWPHRSSGPPYRQLIRTARKWSLDGWRGGLGGSCAMDEYADCGVLAALARSESADGVIAIPGGAIVVDPELIDGMIERFKQVSEEVRMTFCQAPPGLVGTVFATSILEELASKRLPPGSVLSYKPDAPLIDLVSKPCCYQTTQPIRHAAGRLIADTSSAAARLTELLAAHPDPDAETVGRFLIQRDRVHIPPLPHELEIELTTDDPYPDAVLRPRGPRVGRRGPIDVGLVRQIAAELTAGGVDDALVVLGGFGEPLAHPQLNEVLAALGRPGTFGIALRTSGVGLTASVRQALIEQRVDVLEVLLDAWTPELYQRVNGEPAPGAAAWTLGDVVASLDALTQEREARGSTCPIIVPTLTKAVQTVGEMDEFFDGWLRKFGCANIVGYNCYGGRMEDHAVIDMRPPTRAPCRRIMNRCLVLADGRLTMCDQDFAGEHALGSLHEQSLADLWRGPAMQSLRVQHSTGDFALNPLCHDCREWHRP